jgi:hypothetical protein
MDDSSSSSSEEDDIIEMAMSIIMNDEVWRLMLGSQFGRAYINRDRAEGHTKIMQDYFIKGATYPEKYFHR